MMKANDDYTTVKLPNELVRLIDAIVTNYTLGYKSRAEFVKEAVRIRLEDIITAHGR